MSKGLRAMLRRVNFILKSLGATEGKGVSGSGNGEVVELGGACSWGVFYGFSRDSGPAEGVAVLYFSSSFRPPGP